MRHSIFQSIIWVRHNSNHRGHKYISDIGFQCGETQISWLEHHCIYYYSYRSLNCLDFVDCIDMPFLIIVDILDIFLDVTHRKYILIHEQVTLFREFLRVSDI